MNSTNTEYFYLSDLFFKVFHQFLEYDQIRSQKSNFFKAINHLYSQFYNIKDKKFKKKKNTA